MASRYWWSPTNQAVGWPLPLVGPGTWEQPVPGLLSDGEGSRTIPIACREGSFINTKSEEAGAEASTVLLACMIGPTGSQITVAVTFGMVTDPERVKAALA